MLMHLHGAAESGVVSQRCNALSQPTSWPVVSLALLYRQVGSLAECW